MESIDTVGEMQQNVTDTRTSADSSGVPVSTKSSCPRKKRPPARLSEDEQARLSWTVRQTEPPMEALPDDEASKTREDVCCPPEKVLSKRKAPAFRRSKGVKEIIQSRISKEYALSLRLIPFEPCHGSLFRFGEIVLRGDNLDAPGLTADDSNGLLDATTSARAPSSQNTGIYWACKGTDEGDPMHLFWKDPTAPDELGFREVTANVPGDVITALSWRNRSLSGIALLSLRECSSPTSLVVDVLLPERAVRSAQHRYDAPTKQPNFNMQTLVKFFFGVDHIEMGNHLAVHPDYDRILYQGVSEAQRATGVLPISTTELQCPLKVTLREYQRESVAWMVAMETRPPSVEPVELWQPLEDSMGKVVFYNRFAGW
ncbi:E3 ubiquitin-protein ligase SHPRH-like [Tropilaelaps mercedesae]|uniref:E3 ubiquitin-protein ligase SHPRH-like n=1 Tax=Tropilaelaps mercedesae TaxID=418985 RepID=A0A1V9XY24_9ACAR|nr:E3 ubiquitin-protein ligase SHPRH-like [Tropilaelaps mercedesae]